MASTYLQRTMGTPTNNKKWTLSFWIKKSSNDANPYLFTAYNSSQTDNRSWINWQGDNTMSIAHYNVSSYTWRLVTNRLFRDLNAWYHIVVATDTTQATASDRVKLYINGVQETSFSTETYPSQNYDPQFNSAQPFRVGQAHNNTNYFDGSMAHVHLIDGTAYDASYFGLTDATTGIWQPKSYSGSYGTNGFFLKFENSASFGTDSSGNGNNFTVNGTMTQTIDTPSNVFATLNPLQNLPSANTYSQGNNTVTYTVNNDLAEATLGMTSGKYYWEQKYINATGGNAMIGVGNEQAYLSGYLGQNTTGWSYYAPSGGKYHNASTSAYGDSYTTNDIIGIAFDADTRTIWFSKNGTWQNSATISEIGAGTTTNSAYTGMGSAGDLFLPVTSGYNGNVISWNFGNGYFGTTPVSSAENPDDGIGIFEYEVPTGYKALCTKSINAQEYS
jgi:hypothetical protein